MAEPLIVRNEVVALLFDVSDSADSLAEIARLLKEENGGDEKADEG